MYHGIVQRRTREKQDAGGSIHSLQAELIIIGESCMRVQIFGEVIKVIRPETPFLLILLEPQGHEDRFDLVHCCETDWESGMMRAGVSGPHPLFGRGHNFIATNKITIGA